MKEGWGSVVGHYCIVSWLIKKENKIMKIGFRQLDMSRSPQHHFFWLVRTHMKIIWRENPYFCHVIKLPLSFQTTWENFSRHDLAYFEASTSIFLYMSHVSMKLSVLLRFFKNIDSFLSNAQNWIVRAGHDRNTFEASES